MKEKPKLRIMEIDLGIDVSKEIEKTAKNVSKDVKNKIDEMVKNKKARPSKKQLEKKEKEHLEACVQKLFTSYENNDAVMGSDLQKIFEKEVLSPLVLKIRNYLKKNHPEWVLEKVIKDGKSAYRVIKNQASS